MGAVVILAIIICTSVSIMIEPARIGFMKSHNCLMIRGIVATIFEPDTSIC